MTLLTSKRERWLWLGSLVIVITIYLTLGLARDPASLLEARGLLDALYLVGFLLVIATIAVQGLKGRFGNLELGLMLGVTAVYLLLFIRLANPLERTHLIEYSVLAIFIFEALKERKQNGGSVPSPALVAFILTALLGWLDEGIQAVLPNRIYDLRDIVFNCLAGFVAIAANIILGRARKL